MYVILLQISKVDRLQEKLNVMAFMGLFDEYQESLQPVSTHLIMKN